MKLPHLRCALVESLVTLCGAVAFATPLELEAPQEFALGHVSEPIAIGDLNQDGRPDIVVSNTAADGGPGGGSVSVILGTLAGGLVRGGDFPAGERPEWITLADLNGDQKLDVAAADFGGSTVAVLLGDGLGGFGPPILTPVEGNPRCLVAFDFNQDGTLDLATANYDGGSVSVLLGGGNGTFLRIQNLPVGAGPEVLTLARLNGDASPDLVTANALDNTVTPLLNDGNGRFTVGAPFAVEERPRFVLASDLDGDSLDDLFVANARGSSISLLKALPDGLFQSAGRITAELIGVGLIDPDYLALADMTGDGRLDLLTTWAKSDLITIHPATATPFVYDAPRFLETGPTPVGIAAARIDADSDTDIVVSNALGDSCWVFLTASASSGVVVDNGDPGTTPNGSWIPSEAPFPFGEGALFSKDGSRYTWEAELPEAGLYEAMAWWTITTSRSTSALLDVDHAEGRTSVAVNQQKGVGIWHSLGTFSFKERGIVTVTAPIGNASVCADAVRFRPRKDLLAAPPRGTVTLKAKPRPANVRIAANKYLALHAALTSLDTSEPEEWTGLVLAPVGDGEETVEIKSVQVFIDSNHDGSLDPADRALGGPVVFVSESRVLAIQGFVELLQGGVGQDFFVVCELINSPQGRLRLEVASVQTRGVSTQTPSSVTGTPLRGWQLPEELPAVQRPGDGNQDGNLNIADAVHLLGFLFQGSIARLPCGDGTARDPGNVRLLDSNGDGKVDLSDPIRVLNYLFSGGQSPVLGRDCLPMDGCPDNAGKCSG